ncbi:CobW family GTP-binding protein [Knoellia sp. CPCC 206453]|uniref:CobW family GTP-binding protein n=1 Tax=Knoellia pratensis TaxID=3404796 RepID=UPI0036090FBE
MSTHDEKTPVTVLTGFLGSGKTTLVNHILTADHGHRIAVIENEFGEIPIDNALVLGGEEKIVEMSNGCCLCCTARTDLIEILQSLSERREKFDRILIETSGLADPNPVAQTFFVDDEVAKHFTLDAIVTLIDAKHIGAHLDEKGDDGVSAQAFDQIAFADRIVINKVDLVTDGELAALRDRVRGINATAEMITSTYADIDVSQILGIGAFDLTRTMADQPNWLEDTDHQHDPALMSVGVEMAGDVDQDALQAWLSSFVAQHGDDLYRLKGMVAVSGDDLRHVVQGIHRMFDVRASTPWGLEPRTSKMVFIGRDLERETLTAGLRSCVAVERDPACQLQT